MAQSERQEPRFDGDARMSTARLGGLHEGDRPVASREAAPRGGPWLWLLLLAVLAVGGWVLWRYTDIGMEVRA